MLLPLNEIITLIVIPSSKQSGNTCTCSTFQYRNRLSSLVQTGSAASENPPDSLFVKMEMPA